jgi:SAM-dependent methyltransferase
MRLLDAGCGPGSITLGLAQEVAPGEAVGVDANATSIEIAGGRARESGVANVRFEVADIRNLPFADGEFDAVFVHTVLQHLGDPAPALRELHRVLQRGGVIGVADADFGGSILWPDTPQTRLALEIMERVRRFSGGDVFVGRKLRALLGEAGFVDVEGGASAATDGNAARNAATGEFWARYYESPELVAHATAAGVATSDELRDAAAGWRAWGQHGGSYWARFLCHATGRKAS